MIRIKNIFQTFNRIIVQLINHIYLLRSKF